MFKCKKMFYYNLKKIFVILFCELYKKNSILLKKFTIEKLVQYNFMINLKIYKKTIFKVDK